MKIKGISIALKRRLAFANAYGSYPIRKEYLIDLIQTHFFIPFTLEEKDELIFEYKL